MQYCELSDDKNRQLKAICNEIVEIAAVTAKDEAAALRTEFDNLKTALDKTNNQILLVGVQYVAFERQNFELHDEVSTLTACLTAKDGEIERLSAAIVEKDAAAVRMGTQLAQVAMSARVNEEIEHKLIATEQS